MKRFFDYSFPKWWQHFKKGLFYWETWGEEKVEQCEHFQICEIQNLYFFFLGFEIKVPKRLFPRKFFNYWKMYQGNGTL